MKLSCLRWISSNLSSLTGGGRAINALSCLSWKIVLEARNERTWVLRCTNVKQDFFPWDGTCEGNDWSCFKCGGLLLSTVLLQIFWNAILFLFLCVERPFLHLFNGYLWNKFAPVSWIPDYSHFPAWNLFISMPERWPTPVSCWYHTRTPKHYAHPITRLCFWWIPFDPTFS